MRQSSDPQPAPLASTTELLLGCLLCGAISGGVFAVIHWFFGAEVSPSTMLWSLAERVVKVTVSAVVAALISALVYRKDATAFMTAIGASALAAVSTAPFFFVFVVGGISGIWFGLFWRFRARRISRRRVQDSRT